MTNPNPTPVRINGMHARILDKLLEDEIYQTKSEAIKTGVLLLGREHGILDDVVMVKRPENGTKKRKGKK